MFTITPIIGKIRRQHSNLTKLEAAIAMVSAKYPVAELCKKYGVHQSVLQRWRSELLEKGCDIFNRQKKLKVDGPTPEDLERKIGQLTMDCLCWLLIGSFGATIVALFFAFQKELTLTLAGLAIFSTIGSSLKAAIDHETHREPAVITILVSASGISLFGIGAAFWGLFAGILAAFLLNWKKRDNEVVGRTA